MLKKFLARQAMKPSGWFGRTLTTKLLNKGNHDIELFGLQTLDVQLDDRILEIGFGNGRLMKWMTQSLATGKIYGIDFSKDMVKEAEKMLWQEIVAEKAEVKQAGISMIPYERGSFDKIFTCNTIYFWPYPAKDIKEVQRVLKPEGTFICAMRLKDQMLGMKMVSENREIFKNLFTREEALNFFKENGFKNVEVKSKPGKPFDSFLFACKMNEE